MPLSEREQRILDEIERHLHVDDPELARGLSPRSPDAARAKRGLALFLAGVGLLVGFLLSRSLPVGVAAFAAMVVGVVIGAMPSIRLLLGIFDRGIGGAHRRADTLARSFARWEEHLRRRYRRR